ncbi:MAG: VTT domain-containing protein [Coriobacteriales bacterium]|jgi:uncharacterized membrane protein YdjX (TVP38/TMEM64 family)
MGSKRLWAFVGAVLVLLALNLTFGWSDQLLGTSTTETLRALLVDHPVGAAALYFSLTVVGAVALAMPGVVFALVAGTVFGAVEGTLLCWSAVSVAACVSFLVGRYFLRDALRPRLVRYALLDRLLFSGADRSDAYLLAITRLVPVFPYNVQNFAYGVTDIGFVPYAVYSAVFMLPGTAVYTLAAAGVVDEENRVALFVAAAALLALTLLVAWLIKRREAIGR